MNELDSQSSFRTIELIVLDNGSPEKFDATRPLSKGSTYRYLNTEMTLSADINILKSYEAATSDWVYVIGDSKIPVQGFIEKISSDINQYKAKIFIYQDQSTNFLDVAIDSCVGLKNKDLKFGDIILVGNSVISHEIIEQHLEISSQFVYSRSVTAALIFLALENKKLVLFRNSRLLSKFLDKPATYRPGLAILDCWARFNALSTLPVSEKFTRIINRLVLDNETMHSRFIFMKFCLIKIVREKTDIRRELRTIIKYRYTRSFCFSEYVLVRFLLIFSQFHYLIYRKLLNL